MKIAHLLPASAVFPLVKHNGRYEWALRLARLQAATGHSVTIFAGQGSTDESSIQWRAADSNERDRINNNTKLVTTALEDPQFDIFHSHFDSLGFRLASHTTKPVITTQHWFPTSDIAAEIRSIQSKNAIAVPVTNYMQHKNEQLGISSSEVIYHGIDLTLFSPQTNVPRGNRLLYVGRIAPHKGVLEAVSLASRLGEPLDIIGKINDADRTYWQRISPLVDGSAIRYLGQKTQPELVNIYAAAKALLFLPNTIEAFGQTIIEAQACGTPVITNNLGANRELVDHGRTGYIINDIQHASEAIADATHMKSSDCINWVQRFDVQKMVRKYENLYHKLSR